MRGPFTNGNVADEIYATGGTEEMAGRLYGKAGLARATSTSRRSTTTSPAAC